MINSRALPLCVLASIVLCSAASLAQQAAPAVRILTPIDESQLVTLKGNTSPRANAKNDRGSVSPGLILPDLTLVLSRSPEQEAAFEAFISGQYDSSSPDYHQWLTPAEIGEQFGPAQADIAPVTGWLTSRGFAIKSIAPDRMTIRFSGAAAQVDHPLQRLGGRFQALAVPRGHRGKIGGAIYFAEPPRLDDGGAKIVQALACRGRGGHHAHRADNRLRRLAGQVGGWS